MTQTVQMTKAQAMTKALQRLDAALLGVTQVGAPFPALGDEPNVPFDMQALATFTGDHGCIVFATTAARDTAVLGGWLGKLCYVGETLYRLRSGVWVPMRDADFPMGARELTGSAAMNLPAAAGWTMLTVPTLGINMGTGIRSDASGIIVDAPGLYDVDVWAGIGAGAASRRGVGFSLGTGIDPTPFTAVLYYAGANALSQVGFRTSINVTSPTGTRLVLLAYQDSGAVVNCTSRRILVRRTG